MAVFTTLNADVVADVLCALPDFATLAAAIQVSKHQMYAVFSTHKRQVLYAVARTLVGGRGLPFALRAVLGLAGGWQDPSSDEEAKEALAALGVRGGALLEKCHRSIEALEDLFSQSYKDRRSKASVLTGVESARFRRAAYRLWHACVLVGDDRPHLSDRRGTNAQVAKLVSGLDGAEIRQLFETVSFLVEVKGWAVLAHPVFDEDCTPVPSTLVYASAMHRPDVVVDSYRLGPRSIVGERADDQVALHALQDAFRHMPQDKRESVEYGFDARPAWEKTALLDEVAGGGDRCFKCGSERGVRLYGPANWHLLNAAIPFFELILALGGELPRNAVELTAIGRYYCDTGAPAGFGWERFMDQVFDMNAGESGGGTGWSKEHWYCGSCVSRLAKGSFRKWWAEEKRRQNIPVMQDCPYGYTCEQQVLFAHARKFNHLCDQPVHVKL